MHSDPEKSWKDQAFRDWLGQVNGFCLAKFHIGLDDLPDLCTRDAFDSGMSAQDFFENDVMELAREEFGSLVDDLD
jgi:hypothetical protein